MTSTNLILSQASYKESPYEDCSWEVIGEHLGQEDFAPMELSLAKGAKLVADAFFPDYGGRAGVEAVRRWHLPANMAANMAAGEDEYEEEDAAPGISEEELEKIRAEAFEQGKEAAMQEHVVANAERMALIEKRVSQIFHDLATQVREHLKNIEGSAVALALQISEKLIGQAVEINPEYILSIIQSALGQIGGARVFKIRLSPQDLEFIELVGAARAIKDFDDNWNIVADETIRAGCVLETSAGEVDFQLDKAWERVRAEVMRATR